MTWAHGDQKLFIATKNLLHSITVHRGIPSLQSLCQKAVAQYLPARLQSYNLVLPLKLKVAVAEAFDPVIQVYINDFQFVHNKTAKYARGLLIKWAWLSTGIKQQLYALIQCTIEQYGGVMVQVHEKFMNGIMAHKSIMNKS